MKKTLYIALSCLAASVYADGVAPESLKGKQVNFIYEGAAITDDSGNVISLPTWRSRSVVFEEDTSAHGSRSGVMYYTRMLPAVAVISDHGYSGKGYRLNGAKDCQGSWMLYFSDPTHGSAVFMGTEKGKELQFHNVYFTITGPQTGEPEMGRDRQCILVPSKEQVDGAPVSLEGKEVIFSPTDEQKAAIGDMPLDMVFGHCYRGYASDKLYNPMVGVRIPGDKKLSWGTWRPRSGGMTEQVCRSESPISYSRRNDGHGYIGSGTCGFCMEFTSPTEGTATYVVSDGIGSQTVGGIPFKVKPCTRPQEVARFEPAPSELPFPGFESGTDGVRVSWLDTTLAATIRPVPGKPGMVELGVFCDMNGTGDWKVLSRQTVKLPGSIEDVAPLVFECEGAMHFYDEELGEVLGKAVNLPAVD